LVFGAWRLIECWNLVIGISPRIGAWSLGLVSDFEFRT
jgi:hypothetical protein